MYASDDERICQIVLDRVAVTREVVDVRVVVDRGPDIEVVTVERV
jgi:hypothetical protein